MSKIYSYAEFQKIAKVGMRVRAVEGMANACDELADGVVRRITEREIDDSTDCFRINGCVHWASMDGFLELLDDEPEQPERGEITWENIRCGDKLKWGCDGKLETVIDLGVNRKVMLVRDENGEEVEWLIESIVKDLTIIQPTKLETISLADAEKALGKRIIIKE